MVFYNCIEVDRAGDKYISLIKNISLGVNTNTDILRFSIESFH